jgi:hypothetical protein
VLPLWLLSPEYDAVIVSVPPGRIDVVQVATPGLPDVTAVGLHPVFALHVTVPLTTCCFTPFLLVRPLTFPFSPLIVAVKVTGCPYVDGLPLEVTVVVEVASLIAKLPLCGLLEALKLLSPANVADSV